MANQRSESYFFTRGVKIEKQKHGFPVGETEKKQGSRRLAEGIWALITHKKIRTYGFVLSMRRRFKNF